MAVIKQNVSLSKESFKIVRGHGKRIGVKPLSTALNSLILQFDQMQKAQAQPAAEAIPAAQPEGAQS